MTPDPLPVRIRVLLADDQTLLRAGMRLIVDAAPDLVVVGEVGTGQDAVRRAGEADVVVMDIQMPGLDGIEATRLITADPARAHTSVLILTTFEIDEYVLQALQAGASGFLGKTAEPDDVRRAIRTVAVGDSLLSPIATATVIRTYLDRPQRPRGLDLDLPVTAREREIVTLVAAGWSNDEIAAHLVISPSTVKTHVNRAMTKLDVRTRAQLVVVAYQRGLAAL